MNKKILFASVLFGAVVFIGTSCKSPQETAGSRGDLTVMFYNVENLFDVSDDPAVNDEDFTPTGKLHWTEDKLATKVDHISEVISGIDSSYPMLVGLCEIENSSVLDRLIHTVQLRPAGYSYLHKDSPDERGIDVALLYKPSDFVVEESEWITVVLDNPDDSRTRDILYARGKVRGEALHVFVNHWPSRSGGQEKSEPFRIQLAEALRKRIDLIQQVDAGAKIICMGDFNDYPSDKSVSEVLNAGETESHHLFNYLKDDESRSEGTHWYKGHWGPLDQFMGSWSLVKSSKGLSAAPESAYIYRGSFLMFTDKEGNVRPSRTYAGESYTGGYSDHLPIVMKLTVR